MARKVRGRTQVSCVVYPNFAAASERIAADGQTVEEGNVRALVEAEIDNLEQALAPYKRTVECLLADTPLPKTAIRKVAREQLSDSYSFDVKRWQENASNLLP